MKLMNIENIEDFLKVVDSCKGKIELVTDEGDRLNLKSNLCKYVALSKVISEGVIKELELVAYDPEDTNRLIKYMMNGQQR